MRLCNRRGAIRKYQGVNRIIERVSLFKVRYAWGFLLMEILNPPEKRTPKRLEYF
jgi:hypothetical protein